MNGPFGIGLHLPDHAGPAAQRQQRPLQVLLSFGRRHAQPLQRFIDHFQRRKTFVFDPPQLGRQTLAASLPSGRLSL